MNLTYTLINGKSNSKSESDKLKSAFFDNYMANLFPGKVIDFDQDFEDHGNALFECDKDGEYFFYVPSDNTKILDVLVNRQSDVNVFPVKKSSNNTGNSNNIGDSGGSGKLPSTDWSSGNSGSGEVYNPEHPIITPGGDVSVLNPDNNEQSIDADIRSSITKCKVRLIIADIDPLAEEQTYTTLGTYTAPLHVSLKDSITEELLRMSKESENLSDDSGLSPSETPGEEATVGGNTPDKLAEVIKKVNELLSNPNNWNIVELEWNY